MSIASSSQPSRAEKAGSRFFDLLSTEEQVCLMRCSVVRTFNEDLFNTHLRVGSLRLADLVRRGWIEASKGRNRRYWVSWFLHGDAWKAWWPDGPESPALPSDGLKILSKRVAAYCEEHRWHIEQIRQLAVIDPNEAWRLFSERHKAADAEFDLAYSQDLIDALRHQGRTLFLPPTLRDELDAVERRTTTRAMRENDHYQTRDGRFQAREDAQQEFRRLLGTGKPAWMLQLFGRGGIGKTTLLRWFVSRACLTGNRTVPCAVINCDEFDPVIILSQPWLLLIEAAEQLSAQLPGSPFLDLVESFGHFRATLRPGEQRPAAVDASISGRDIKRAAQDVENNFCRNAPRDRRPFVIILDGLDQVTLESRAAPTQLREMIRMLRRIHHDKEVSDLRVVLAGRDALHKLLPELDEEPGVSNFAVRNFNLDETANYLRGRGIPDRERIEAIHGQSSIPMIVALYADWLADKHDINAKQIRENTEPQIYYLISRILNRIGNGAVRDTLLYSVAVPPPAALDFEFFRAVMLPLWRQRYKRRDIPGSSDAEGQQRLWAEVLDYASDATATWISATDSPTGKAVTVHDDVRLALLAKVRDHQAFADLHQRAANFYREKAAASGEDRRDAHDWPVLTARVAYHLIQRGDPGAIDFWRAAVARCRAKGRTDWVQTLATAITRQRDFRGAEGVPDLNLEKFPGLGGEGLPVRAVLAPLLYEAYVELAWLAAQDNGSLPFPPNVTLMPGLSPVTSLANAAAVRTYAKAEGIDIPIADYEVIVSALIAIEDGDPDGALENFHPAPGQASGDAWLVRARTHAKHRGTGDPPEAGSTLDRVLDAYEHAFDRYVDPRNISYASVDAGHWLLSIDRPDLALEWASRAADAWITVHPEGAAAEVKAHALLALGRPGSALAAIVPPSWDRLPPTALTLAAEAQLALRRPRKALDELRDDDGTATGLSARMLIDQDLAEAKAYGMLLDSENAMRCFSQAERRLLEAGQADPRDLTRINTARALFELRTTGSIHQARSYLSNEFDTSLIRPGGSTWTDFQLARAELADRVEDATEVRQILDEAGQRHTETGAPAGLRVRAAVAGLNCRSLPAPDRRRRLATLADELAKVTPSARMALLAGLMYCPPVELITPVDHELARRLRSLAVDDAPNDPATNGADADPLDRAWQNLVSAQVLRVVGERGEAGERRADAMLTLEDPFARWDVLAARPERPAAVTLIAPEAILPSPHEFRDKYGDHPVLFAAYITEWGIRAERAYLPEEITRWLQTAQRSLASRPGLRPTAWAAKLLELIAEIESPYSDPVDHPLYDEAMAIWVNLGVVDPPSPEAGSPHAPTATTMPAVELIFTDHESGEGVLVRCGRQGHEESSLALRDVSFDVKSPALEWGHRVGRRASVVLRDLQDASVRFDFKNPALAARPWELTAGREIPLAANPAVRDIFRTATDPLRARHELALRQWAYQELGPLAGDPCGDPPGPARWAAVRAALRDRASRPLRVCLVQPMVGGNLDSERRFIDRRLELRLIYQRAFNRAAQGSAAQGSAAQGSAARVLDFQSLYGDEVLDLYTAAAPADWVDVIHVITVMEATEEMPVLNLDTRKGPPMTAPQLDFLVRRLSNPIPPLVIIDVQPPPSLVESRRHLLMRNRFAQQLLALGTVGTIIASGLTDSHATEQWRYIAKGLADGQNAAEICRKIQLHKAAPREPGSSSLRPASAHEAVFQATALFTNIHPDWLLEPGLFTRPSQVP